MDKQQLIKLGSNLQRIITFAENNPELWEVLKVENKDKINELKNLLGVE